LVGLAASAPPIEAMDEGWADERRLADLLRPDRAAGVDALTKLYQGYADDPPSIFASLDDPSNPDAALFATPDVNEGRHSGIGGLRASRQSCCLTSRHVNKRSANVGECHVVARVPSRWNARRRVVVGQSESPAALISSRRWL
jgi:hypothetical protein